MKRVLCLIFAALLLASAGCAKSGNGKHGAAPTQTPTVVTVPTDKPNGETYAKVTPAPEATGQGSSAGELASSVVFEGGRVVSGAFNWEFFTAKAGASMAAEIDLVETRGGSSAVRRLSFEDGVYAIEGEGMRKSFRFLKTETVSGPDFAGTIAYLTNEPDLNAQELLASLSEPASIGAQSESGVIVYLDRAD